MKIVLSLSLAALLTAAGISHVQAQTAGAQPPADSPQVAGRPAVVFKKLNRAEFDALLKEPAKVIVIDVRRPDELQSNGGFPVYLSIQAGDLETQLAFVPKDRSIITVSNHAARAGRAAELLAKNGFTVAGVIGAQDYEAEGGTLVKIAPPKTVAAAAAKTEAGK